MLAGDRPDRGDERPHVVVDVAVHVLHGRGGRGCGELLGVAGDRLPHLALVAAPALALAHRAADRGHLLAPQRRRRVAGRECHGTGRVPPPGLDARHRHDGAAGRAQDRHVHRAVLLAADEGLALEQQHGQLAGDEHLELGDGAAAELADAQDPLGQGDRPRQVVLGGGAAARDDGIDGERPGGAGLAQLDVDDHVASFRVCRGLRAPGPHRRSGELALARSSERCGSAATARRRRGRASSCRRPRWPASGWTTRPSPPRPR